MLLSSATLLLLASSVSAEVYKLDLGAKNLEKRSYNESLKLEGLSSIFEGTIEYGSPGQEITAIFDTGSYTLGVMWSGNEYCDTNSCSKGTYDPSKSSTSSNTSRYFDDYGFVDGSRGTGYYFEDTVHIAGLEINDFQANVIQESNEEINTFGIGPDLRHRDAPILLNYLVNDNITERRVFSSYYSETTDKAVLLFGGLDKDRYSGQLQKVPTSNPYYYSAVVSGLSTDCGTLNSNGYIYMLDTGASFGAGFPSVIYHRLNQLYGGSIVNASINLGGDNSEEFYAFKCQNAKPLNVNIQGNEVTWSARSQILPITSNGKNLIDEDGDELCTTFMEDLGDSDYYVLGSNFLKDMYVVWDGDSGDVAIAQGKESDSEDLVEITGDIPDAVNAPDYDKETYNTNDTSYNQAATTSLSGSSFVATGTYTGTFATGSCSSTSSTTTLSSASASSASSSSPQSSSTGSSARLTTPSSSQVSSSTSSTIKETTPVQKGVTTVDSSSSLISSQISSTASGNLTTIHSTSYSSTASGICVSCANKELKNRTSTAIESENTTVLKTITSCSDDKCSEVVTTIEPSTTESSAPSSTPSSSAQSSSSLTSSPVISTAVETSSSEKPTSSSSSNEIEVPSSSAPSAEGSSNPETQSTTETSAPTTSPESSSSFVTTSEQATEPTSSSEPTIETSSEQPTTEATSSTPSTTSFNPSLAPKESSVQSSSSSTVSIESNTSSIAPSTSSAAAISTYEGGALRTVSTPFFFRLISRLF